LKYLGAFSAAQCMIPIRLLQEIESPAKAGATSGRLEWHRLQPASDGRPARPTRIKTVSRNLRDGFIRPTQAETCATALNAPNEGTNYPPPRGEPVSTQERRPLPYPSPQKEECRFSDSPIWLPLVSGAGRRARR